MHDVTMPAKKRNKPKYKAFIGRTFTLRNNKIIPGYPTMIGSPTRKDYLRGSLPNAVIIFDETNTQVRISDNNGNTLWISKYYLHNEIINSQFKNIDDLNEYIFELLGSTEIIKSATKDFNKEEILSQIVEIESIVNKIKLLSDNLNPTKK